MEFNICILSKRRNIDEPIKKEGLPLKLKE